MLSKLLRGTESEEAQPFVYRAMGGPAARKASETTQPNLPSKEAPQDADRLRARIAELEANLEQAAKQIPLARQSALREGENAGKSQAESALKPVIERLCRGIQDLIEMKPRVRKGLEEETVQLSIGIARRILRREISMDPSALQGLVQVAFERVGRQEIVRVIAHPDQVANVRASLSHLSTRQIEIVADGSRETGTVIFETTRGAIDASVDSQLREIELGLADRLKWRS